MSEALPLFSVITPVYNPPIDVLREMIASVRAQTFVDWELILIDDCSPDPRVLGTLRESAASDSRIRVIERETNGHIVAASNDGVNAARGEFMVLLDHDDLLVEEALERVSERLATDPEIDYVYSDEDKVDAEGDFYDLFMKPDWSPERLRGQMYTCHLSTLRSELVREVGGFHEGFDGSQDHDLVLRVTERARAVAHIPEVLYHWRVVPGSAAGDPDAKPYAWIAGRKAVQEQLNRLGVDATVEFSAVPGTYTLVRRLANPAEKISIIIPTRGGSGMVWGEKRCFVVEAVRSVLNKCPDRNLEFVVVYDTSTPASVMAELKDLLGRRLIAVPFEGEFNFSEKCNRGYLHATGERLIFLNDDIEALSEQFLDQLVAPLDDPTVGMTGAHLFFEDGTLQHGGHSYYGEHLRHVLLGAAANDPGPYAALCVNREASGLTAACIGMRREVFQEVGGFSESLPVNFNDVDLSRKVGSAGYRMLWIANARLYHFESQTRVPVVHKSETEFVWSRWSFPEEDPYMPGIHY